MCGRFAQQRPAADLADRFAAQVIADDPGPRYNVAPTTDALVVVQRDDRRAVTAYRWGLVPHWATSLSAGTRAFNARAETVATSPMFRDAFRRRRCLVPVEAFYEWRRDGKLRRPHAIRRADGDVIALAGLWSGWRDPETEQVTRTFTIVTTAANDAIAELHDRMPVILPEEDWATWLQPAGAEPARLRALLEPREGLPLELFEVSRRVNDARNEGPELLVPLAD